MIATARTKSHCWKSYDDPMMSNKPPLGTYFYYLPSAAVKQTWMVEKNIESVGGIGSKRLPYNPPGLYLRSTWAKKAEDVWRRKREPLKSYMTHPQPGLGCTVKSERVFPGERYFSTLLDCHDIPPAPWFARRAGDGFNCALSVSVSSLYMHKCSLSFAKLLGSLVQKVFFCEFKRKK